MGYRQVQIKSMDEELWRRARLVALAKGKTMAQYVADALRRQVETDISSGAEADDLSAETIRLLGGRLRLPSEGANLDSVTGWFESGQPDIARKHDEYLAEAYARKAPQHKSSNAPIDEHLDEHDTKTLETGL